ncbi:hypothetical protein JOE31_000429 [Arthrobacter sp. PvP023]|nr:hypothetical protein [Arthrobacter sp. PvP023]
MNADMTPARNDASEAPPSLRGAELAPAILS